MRRLLLLPLLTALAAAPQALAQEPAPAAAAAEPAKTAPGDTSGTASSAPPAPAQPQSGEASREPPPGQAPEPFGPPPDIAYGAYQRGYFLTAFREATKRIEANPGDAAAMTLLGELYSRGLGVRQDWESAAKWYKLAAGRGDKRAAYNLAMLHLQGTGTDKNPEEARRLLETAADSVPDAAYALGLMLLGDNSPESDRRAVTLFRSAVGGMTGDPEYALAVLYRQGRGVPRDARQAAIWMGRAAALRNASAQLEYGIMLFNGDGVDRDEARAAKFFARAAQRGNPVAQNRLARLYAAGRGVDRNVVEAAKWHILARDNGVKDEWLDQVVRDLGPAERDKAEAEARAWRER